VPFGAYPVFGSHDDQFWGHYYAAVYGNPAVLPLIGGSGGSICTRWGPNAGGGAGGGAILIACPRTITLSPSGAYIRARGGSSEGYQGRYGGSGGAIRLIADAVQGPGSLDAWTNGWGGAWGRIRIEANSVSLTDPGAPRYTLGSPGATAVLWPSDLGNAPSARIISVGGQPAPTDPRASLDFPGADVTVPSGGAQLAVIETRNVPLDWSVVVKVVPKQGYDDLIRAAYISGDDTLATWNATLPLSSGFTVVQVRASKPTATATASEAEESTDAESSNVEPDAPTP